MNAKQAVNALSPCAQHFITLDGDAGKAAIACHDVFHLPPDQRVSDQVGNVLLYNGYHWMSNGGSPCGLTLQAGHIQSVRWLRHEGQVTGLIGGRESTATITLLDKVKA
jgi:hypothetical protein